MPFTVEEFRDLVQLLEARPEWRAELRRLILTEELLTLPQIVQQLTQRVNSLVEQMISLTQRVESLTEQMISLTQRVDSLTQRVDSLTEQMISLTQRVDSLTQRVDSLTEQMISLTQRVDSLTQRVDSLTEQMISLTQRVDSLTQRVDSLTEQMISLTQRVDSLTEQMSSLTQRVDLLTEQMISLTQQVSELTQQVRALVEWQRGEAGRREGERYERSVIKRAPMFFSGGAGGATDDARVQERLSKWLRSILDSDRFLEPDEDPTLSDLIWWKGEQVVVVEASLKVNGDDVMRAVKRAKTLQSAGVNATPVVIGEDWANLEARELAKEKGVWWMVGGIPSEGFISFRRLSPELEGA